jgi:Uma2 family endonuclease
MAAVTTSPDQAVPEFTTSATPFRLSLDQYERMVDAGILGARDKVQLINAILVAKMTENDRHATADDLCGAKLNEVLPPGWYVRAGKPIRLPSQVSKPEPDRTVVRGQIRDYTRRSPEPRDIALVVEVADSSLTADREQANLYAQAGIPIYRIINVKDAQVEVYSSPGEKGYQNREVLLAGDKLTPGRIPKYGYAAAVLACCFIDGWVDSSS